MRLLLSLALPLLASADSYVATIEKVSGTVGFYSEAGQNEGRVKVGAFPHEAVLSKDGRLLYVSNNGVLWMTEDTMGTNSHLRRRRGIEEEALRHRSGSISPSARDSR